MRAIVMGEALPDCSPHGPCRILRKVSASWIGMCHRKRLRLAKACRKGRHVHGLLAGGLDALRLFFPGILDGLTAEGSRLSDTAQDVLWFNNGAWRLRSKCGVTGCIQTRPLLELHIRRRVEKLPNVRQLYGVSLKGLEMDATKSRVAGVRIAEDGGPEKILPADLVVDCSGRGSKTPAWLEAAGLGKPPKAKGLSAKPPFFNTWRMSSP